MKGVIDDVAEAGGDAAMAMLGETVFAFGTASPTPATTLHLCDYPPGATIEDER